VRITEYSALRTQYFNARFPVLAASYSACGLRAPLMSMWMSGANAVMGAARSRATAEGKRQAATMMSHGTKEVARFWTNALMPSTRKHKKSR